MKRRFYRREAVGKQLFLNAVKRSSNNSQTVVVKRLLGAKGRVGEFARKPLAVNSRPADAGEFATHYDARVAGNLPEDPSDGEFNL